MIFTAMVREILLNSVQTADARLDGIEDKGSPYKVIDADATFTLMYIDAEWLPGFNIGGGNFIITGEPSYGGFVGAGGLILAGDGLPYETVKDGSDNPILDGGNFVYYVATYDESEVLTGYKEFTSANSVFTETVYNLDGAGGTVGLDTFDPGSVDTTKYLIHLAVPMLSAPIADSTFIVIKQNENTSPGVSGNAIDLRQYIANITFTTTIDKGYDTCTVELNESASNLGKYYSYLLGQNIEIMDIYGNICWNGLVTSIYVDGGGGRLDAVGYKTTMEWFRFDKIYAAPELGWDSTNHGPTSSQVLHDATLMNPYCMKITEGDTPTNWGLIGYVYGSLDLTPTGQNWPDAQLTVTTNIGLDELDFSDGSFKCSDAIEMVESFGYAYTNENVSIDKDTMYVQFWNNGWAKILRVRKLSNILVPDYIITKRNLQHDNKGAELSGDINDIVTETYVIYSDTEGVSNVSSSNYNVELAKRFGMRLKIESSDFGPALASLVSAASRADKSQIVGIGNVSVTGNLKGGGGAMYNTPAYMVRAGKIISFEDNIGHGSLYRSRDGSPGLFYIGSTSFSTSTGELTITPAETLSVVDMFIKRQSRLTN